jgi:hypothetical protein
MYYIRKNRNVQHRNNKVGGCPLINSHFKECPGNPMIQIIEIFKNGENEERKLREKFWMQELKTVAPYGMNKKFAKNREDVSLTTYGSFNKRRKQHIRGLRNNRSKKNKHTNIHQLLDDIWTLYSKQPKFVFANILNSLWSLNIFDTTKIISELDNFVGNENLRNVIIDFCTYKLHKHSIQKDKTVIKTQTKERASAIFTFTNHINNQFHPNRIFSLVNVKDKWPNLKTMKIFKNNDYDKKAEVLETFEKPIIYYKYTKPIGTKIFNYKSFKSAQYDGNVCYCNKYRKWINKHFGHVCTGDVNIAKSDELASIFEKGPKYRLPTEPNFQNFLNNFLEDLDNYVDKICTTLKLNRIMFNPWCSEILKTLEERNSKSSRNHSSSFNIISGPNKHKLERLRKELVITYVDKAAQNYAFVCHQLYNEQVNKELNSDTYISTNLKSEDVMRFQNQEIMDLLNLKNTKNNSLPFITLVPKFHKNPMKFRSIIASAGAPTEIVSKILSKVLKLIAQKLKNYYNAIESNTGIKLYWICNNNKDFIKMFEKLNRNKKLCSISSFDFSTLYTKIPHKDLIEKLQSAVDLAFHHNDKLSIYVTNIKTGWAVTSHKDTADGCKLTRSKIKEMILWLVENTYFTYIDKVYKQTIGIPMGTSCGPFLANLYLMTLEAKYMIELTKKNYSLAKSLNNITRYIDDVVVLNDGGSFETIYKDIYPQCLELNRTNANEKFATFLDLQLNIENDGSGVLRLYDKRKDYTFRVQGFPDISGNISSAMCYNVAHNEFNRYKAICTREIDFTSNSTELIDKLTNKNYSHNKLWKMYNSIKNRHS